MHDRAAAIPCRDVVAADDGFAARGPDLVDDRARRRRVTPVAFGGGPDVVDDDVCAFGGEQQGVRPADASPGAGDDRDFAFEQTHAGGVFP